MSRANQLARALLNSAAQGGVGDTRVQPRYVGSTVAPRYVGAPVEMVQSLGQQPIRYSPEAYTAGGVTYMGLGETVVLAGAVNQQITIQSIRPFTPQKLLCASTVIDLLINQISVGGINLFASNNGVPIELFSEVSTAPQIEWLTVNPAVGIVFSVSNPTGGNLLFKGALYGTDVRN